MKHVLLLAAAFAVLTACNKSPTVEAKNATPEEVAKQVSAAGGERVTVNPGKWVSKVTIENMHVPGAPPAMEAQMKGRGSEERDYCLTPEEAKKPKENFFGGNRNECRYDHFTMGGGKIDAAMRCTHDKLTQVVNFKGSYSPNSYELAMDSSVAGGSSEMAGMSMSMRVDAKRVGECSAKAQ